MHKQQSGFGLIEILVAVVVIVVLAGAGYLFVQNMNSQSDNTSTNNSSTESASMDHEDHESMMEGWQTFTSSTYDFSFKYPENWSVAESTVETFPNQPNAIVKNEAGEEVLGVYGYLGTGCEDTPTGNEPTEKVTVADTEVTVTKDCNSNWSWIMADAADGSDLTITTWSFLGEADENEARMLLGSVTGLSNIMAHDMAGHDGM